MARTLPPSPAERLPFLRRTAATAVVLLGGAVLADAGCKREAAPAPEAAVVAPTEAAADAADPGDAGAGDAAAPDAAADDATEPAAEVVAVAPDVSPESVAEATGDADAPADAGDEAADAASPTAAARRDGGVLAVLSEFPSLDGIFGTDDDLGPTGRAHSAYAASGGGAAPDLPLGIGGSGSLNIRPGPVTADGGLAPEVVRRIVGQHRGRLRSCGEHVSITNGPPVGKVRLGLTIHIDGRVADARIVRNETGSSPLEACILAAARQFLFPEAERPTTATAEIVYEVR
jgi:hypothetical protein